MEVFLPTFFEDSVWTTFGTAVLSAKDGKSLTTKLNWIFKSGDRVCIINQCKAYKKDKQGWSKQLLSGQLYGDMFVYLLLRRLQRALHMACVAAELEPEG